MAKFGDEIIYKFSMDAEMIKQQLTKEEDIWVSTYHKAMECKQFHPDEVADECLKGFNERFAPKDDKGVKGGI